MVVREVKNVCPRGGKEAVVHEGRPGQPEEERCFQKEQ